MKMTNKVSKLTGMDLLSVFILVLLVAIRIPYFLTSHIQEDAYIHFQHMRSLADTGVFGFNLGEKVNGSTSPLYTLIYSPIFAVVPSAAIPIILIINSVMLIFAVIILAYTFYPKSKHIYFIIVLAALMPVSLLTSYSGMETSFLIFCYSVLLFDLSQNGGTRYRIIALLLLPFIRLDSIAFAGLYLLILVFIDSKRAIRLSILYFLSLVTLLIIYQLYFGSWLPETIIGKATTYDVGDRSIETRLSGMYNALSNILLPVLTRYLLFLKPIFFVALIAFCVWLILRYRGTALRSVVVLLVAYSVITPAIYGASSVVFPWYLWPASIFVFTLLVGEFVTFISRQKKPGLQILVATLGILCAGLALLQWLVSFDNGTQEFHYRRSIGLWISEHPLDGENTSVMLEPIGYIGYHCECYVHDTVGLVSPLVTEYRRVYGDGWYFEYVEDQRPTYLLLREGELQALQQIEGFEEQLGSQYTLQHTFTYAPSNYFHNPIILLILSAGSDIPYLLFVRNDLIPNSG